MKRYTAEVSLGYNDGQRSVFLHYVSPANYVIVPNAIKIESYGTRYAFYSAGEKR